MTRPHRLQDVPARPWLLPWKPDPDGEYGDASFLQLLGRQRHGPLGPPVGDDHEDLGHRRVSAPREPSAQKVFQGEACLCAPSSEHTQREETKRSQSPADVRPDDNLK